MVIFYPCPKCGKKESSWDGVIYCGSCEPAYQKEQERLKQMENWRVNEEYEYE
jgi:uncharacterized Zn finger protein (UPF0148 family)